MPRIPFSPLRRFRPPTRSHAFPLLPVVLLAALHTACEREELHRETRPEATPTAEGVLRVPREAQESMGLATAKIAAREVSLVMERTGWLEVPPDRRATIKAPVTGFVLPASDKGLPSLGATLEAGTPLASLRVFLSPQEEAQLVAAKEEADTVMSQSLVTMRLAEQRLERLRVNEDVTTAAKVAEIQESYERAKAAYKEASERLPFLPKEPYGEALQMKVIPLLSPLAGHAVTASVAAGQLVSQGEALWTVEDWSRLWLRLPLFEADIQSVAHDAPARVKVPGAENPVEAKPVAAPQPTRPGLPTVDLLYEVENGAGQLRPGLSVLASLTCGKTVERLVISAAATLWDGQGNAWVYVRTGPDAFRRQRIEVGSLIAEGVVVERGLSQGDEVVQVGAETLYGEEFKAQIPVEEEEEE